MNTKSMSHSSDPDTSRIAAESVDPHESARLKLAILDLLGEAPRTADELTAVYFRLGEMNGWPQLHDAHNVKRRLSELHAKHHVIRESGDRRPSAHGRPSTVWELAVTLDEARTVVNAA